MVVRRRNAYRYYTTTYIYLVYSCIVYHHMVYLVYVVYGSQVTKPQVVGSSRYDVRRPTPSHHDVTYDHEHEQERARAPLTIGQYRYRH